MCNPFDWFLISYSSTVIAQPEEQAGGAVSSSSKEPSGSGSGSAGEEPSASGSTGEQEKLAPQVKENENQLLRQRHLSQVQENENLLRQRHLSCISSEEIEDERAERSNSKAEVFKQTEQMGLKISINPDQKGFCDIIIFGRTFLLVVFI